MGDMDCLNNTARRRQWSLCIRLFSGDDYSSGDLCIDSPRCRTAKSTAFTKHTEIKMAKVASNYMQMQIVHAVCDGNEQYLEKCIHIL